MSKEIKNPVKAIRAFCVECMGGSSQEVKNCTSAPGSRYPCPLYPFRQGENPFRTKERSEAQKEAAMKNIERMQELNRQRTVGEENS